MEEHTWEKCKYAFVSKGDIGKSLYETILHGELRKICDQLEKKHGPRKDLIVEGLQDMFGMMEIYGCENPEILDLNIYHAFKLEKDDKTIARIAYLMIDRNVLHSSGINKAERIKKRLTKCKICKFYQGNS